MEEFEIQKHSFEVAKSKIQKYADSAPQGVTLPRVKTDGGLFGWGDHKVTGDELNSCMGEVQTSLISLNNASKAIISEFKEVYNAFEALDKDYISGIILSVNAAKKASDDAKKASDDIAKTIGALKITVGKLSDFQKEVKSDMASLEARSALVNDKLSQHIEGVDSLWRDLQKHYESYKGFYSACVSYKSQVSSALDNFENQINDLRSFRNVLEHLSHLQEVDVMWESIRKQGKLFDEQKIFLTDYVENIDSSISQLKEGLSIIQAFNGELEQYHHLSDIDTIWDEHQKCKTGVDAVSVDLNKYKQAVDESLDTIRNGIAELKEYSDKLKSYSHLHEVNTIWEDTRELKKSFDMFQQNYDDYVVSMATKVGDLSITVSTLSSEISNHEERLCRIESNIEIINNRIDTEKEAMSHKVRINHIISASSILLFLSLMVLIFLEVL